MTNDTQSEREFDRHYQTTQPEIARDRGIWAMEWSVWQKAWQAARTQTPPVSAAMGKHEAFFDAVWNEYCQQDLGLEDAAFILDIALRLGLVREEKYDEAVHGQNHSDRWELEEGDSIYLKNALSTPPKGDSNVS